MIGDLKLPNEESRIGNRQSVALSQPDYQSSIVDSSIGNFKSSIIDVRHLTIFTLPLNVWNCSFESPLGAGLVVDLVSLD